MASRISISQTNYSILNLKNQTCSFPRYGSSYSSLSKPLIPSSPISAINPSFSSHGLQVKNQIRSCYSSSKTKTTSTLSSSKVVPLLDKPKPGQPEEYVEIRDQRIVSWIDSLPEKIQPYAYLMRLDRQIGTIICAWPSMWAVALAAAPGSLPDWKMLAFFYFVSFWYRSLGCTINDYLDKDFDAQVERTKRRPIASGAISGLQAMIFLAVQVVLGYAMLFPVNQLSRLLWVSSMPLLFTYPFMKRILPWPTLQFGFTINWGVLYSWAAVKGTLHPSIVLPLLMSSYIWTLEADALYSHQDKADDVKAGVKSAALFLGDSTKQIISICAVASVASLALSAFNADIGWPFYILMVPAFAQLAWQIYAVDLNNPADCGRKFQTNKYYGALVFFAILVGRLFS
ncbi:OLC1v1005234C1 [Oldenlandia corymbosa var. corymbosa]|uniref:4-hydroxybenzoate polyprenyltransferase, mitochondrial n=1 Tax=Oldenlandia corymbosa var. corymbosa TaxID=529605 RepID=A0AAV1DEX3_OLDCO|nr:OLC1v1005234C1 [Oldenlandia corymbosa var. corymbosa]